MAIFNSFLYVYQAGYQPVSRGLELLNCWLGDTWDGLQHLPEMWLKIVGQSSFHVAI